MKKLFIILLFLSSCIEETVNPPCGECIVIEWSVKCSPIIEVPIPGALDYYEVKAKLYDDLNEYELLEDIKVKQDTVILDATNIDISKYQNNRQICEIYLIEYN
jgi:hypothetical protein